MSRSDGASGMELSFRFDVSGVSFLGGVEHSKPFSLAVDGDVGKPTADTAVKICALK
jgi:hypothetical protein